MATTFFGTLNRRDALRLGVAGTAAGLASGLVWTPSAAAEAGTPGCIEDGCERIEPQAGTWKTWVLPSGSSTAVPPPPGEEATRDEIAVLEALASQRDAAAIDRIKFWDAGAAYRWAAIAIDKVNQLPGIKGLISARHAALAMVAMYDATVAAWHWKYAYDRRRPSRVAPRLTTVVPTPRSPSYPSEYAAVAGAVSAVLSLLYSNPPNPAVQAALATLVEEAGRSRLLAGVEYPSDVRAGLALGRAVGALLVDRANNDGFSKPWTGTVPTVDPTGRGDPVWNGANPIFPLAGTWKTWVLRSGDQFRPGPHPSLHSAAGMADLNQVVTFNRDLNGANFSRNAEAFFAQTQAGILGEFVDVNQRIQEERLADNPPRAARAHALLGVTMHDAMVACWDAKYTYWRIRPFQAHPGLVTLFPTPNHPSYPAAHGAGSGAGGAMAAYLFPRDATSFTNNANQLAQSRLWAGIHYQSDIDVGLALGRQVAQAVIAERANVDGSNSIGAAAQAEACQE